MNSTTWSTVAGLALTTAVIKAFGPVIFGGRDLPTLLARTIPLLAPALLAALVVVETFGANGRSVSFDARAGGLAVASVALAVRAPLVVVVLCAAVATAVVRALT
ncbi:MAG: AzlD domain-containing protein [Solirubrobacteraceae bacterium]